MKLKKKTKMNNDDRNEDRQDGTDTANETKPEIEFGETNTEFVRH